MYRELESIPQQGLKHLRNLRLRRAFRHFRLYIESLPWACVHHPVRGRDQTGALRNTEREFDQPLQRDATVVDQTLVHGDPLGAAVRAAGSGAAATSYALASGSWYRSRPYSGNLEGWQIRARRCRRGKRRLGQKYPLWLAFYRDRGRAKHDRNCAQHHCGPTRPAESTRKRTPLLHQRLDPLPDMRTRRHRQGVISQTSMRSIRCVRHREQKLRVPLTITERRNAQFIASLFRQQRQPAFQNPRQRMEPENAAIHVRDGGYQAVMPAHMCALVG